MKVSIIIPFHKGISFLGECLQSLVEQNFDNIEVILVCDHIEEDVETFIKPIIAIRSIKILELKDKTGVAAARNLGLSEATGEYIYFLDSDDYIGASTLESLVKEANEKNCDLVYGKKIGTWFKRSIFIKNFTTGENESEEEDEEESKSFDSEEPNQKSQKKELESIKDTPKKSENRGTLSQTQLKKKAAYDFLVTKEKGVRDISVLNLLIKRSVIEDNKILFNEKIKYLSDYSFLFKILTIAKEYEYQPEAIYIKRSHNFYDLLPSLSQMKGSQSFNEYVAAYKYTMGLIKNNNDLRALLDQKVIDYCVYFFAPKLVCDDGVDREKKFQTMHQIISRMDKELLQKQKKNVRKLLSAFCTGYFTRTKKAINRYLSQKKFKAVTKSWRAFFKFLYMEYFLKMSLKRNWVLCESFLGKSYSDSPKYIYEYISKNYPGRYKFIWVIDKKKTKIPYKHIKVKRFGLRYEYYLARSKYYVFNGRQPEWAIKREDNVFLQTWHGTPLKRLVFDRENINAKMHKYKLQVYKQSRDWDYLIAPNQYASDIFRSCFRYDKEMLETGYPRNDILYAKDKEQRAENIRTKLGISKDKKILLYAPTFRDDEMYSAFKYKFTLNLDLDLLKKKLGKEYVIILRTHYFIADSLDLKGLENFAYNLSNYEDIAELYLISDILITDYSSAFFDYGNLKRPMLFFAYDFEKYRDVLHGFYIDMEEELPGPLLYTTEEVVSAIGNLDKLEQEYHQKYLAFYNKYCSWEDGQASRNVAEKVFDLKGDLNETDN